MRRWLFSVTSAALLCGCVAYHPQPLKPEQSEAELRARSAFDPGLKQFVESRYTNVFPQWPPASFDLRALTAVALYFQPDMEVARARVRSAQAAEITAGARPNPTLSVLPTYVASSFPDEPPWMLGVSLDIPIETAGKRGKRIEQARETTRAAELTLAESAWKTRSTVRAALIEFMEAGAEVKLFQDETAETSRWIQMLDRRLAAGDISRLELNMAQNQKLAADLALGAAQTRLAAARSALSGAVGLTVSALDQLPIAWPGFDQPPQDFPLDRLQEIGLTHRLDIQRALAEYAALEAALKLAIAGQYPDIHLDPGYEFDQGEHKFSLGPSITLPIFDHNAGPISEALAKRNEAAASFLALQSDAIHQMEAAQVNYRAALEEWKTTDRIANEILQRVEKATESEVEAGESDRAALFQARLQRSAASRARLASARKVQDALGALEDAVQREIKNE